MAENPATDLLNNGIPVGPDYVQNPVISQVAEAVFGNGTLPVHPARRRHRAGPVPGRQHRLQRLPAARLDPRPGPLPAAPAAHPRRPARLLQRHRAAGRRGRACWSGIYGADSTRLIQLYIVGVFVSFTLSQTGMVRHWNRHLATETDPAKRRHMIRSRAINSFGAFFTGLVLVVVLLTKFTARRLGRRCSAW